MNNNKIFSYLEFGSIDMVNSKKHVWDLRIGPKAYDWFMCARYVNDMLSYIRMTEELERLTDSELRSLYTNGIHHANDLSVNLNKLIALICADRFRGRKSDAVSFAELGSTIFGCIEGIQFCKHLLLHYGIEFPDYNFREIQWFGVDISDMFNKLAVLLHQGYMVQTMKIAENLPADIDVFFAKGISLLYAIRSPEQLMQTISNSRISIFDYSFSMDGRQETTIGTGKTVVYLDFSDTLSLLKKSKKKMYVKKGKSFYTESNKRIFIDTVFAEEPLAREFISIESRIHDACIKKFSHSAQMMQLLDIIEFKKPVWMPIDEFVSVEVKSQKE